jgi:hypothetical protein
MVDRRTGKKKKKAKQADNAAPIAENQPAVIVPKRSNTPPKR